MVCFGGFVFEHAQNFEVWGRRKTELKITHASALLSGQLTLFKIVIQNSKLFAARASFLVNPEKNLRRDALTIELPGLR